MDANCQENSKAAWHDWLLVPACEPHVSAGKSCAGSSKQRSAHLYFQEDVYLVCGSHHHLFCLHIHSVHLPPCQSFQLHLE